MADEEPHTIVIDGVPFHEIKPGLIILDGKVTYTIDCQTVSREDFIAVQFAAIASALTRFGRDA